MLNNDEGSLKGKGASIMLPPKGNPFRLGEAAPAAQAISSGAETEPRDLSPEDLAALFPGAAPAEAAAPAATGADNVSFAVSWPEPTPAPEESDPGSSLRSDPDLPGHDLTSPFAEMSQPEPTDAAPSGPTATDSPSLEDRAALDPSSPADRGAGGVEDASASGIPPGAAPLPGIPLTAPGMAIPATTVGGGQALPGMRAFAGAQIQVSDNVGISLDTFKPGVALKGKAELVNMLVPDGRLVTLWMEIDSVEAQVANTLHLSYKGGTDLLDRLAAARNFLMNDRDNFEEAERQVAEVKFRLAALKRSRLLEQSEVILLYLLVFMIVVVVGLLATGNLGAVITGKGTPAENLVWTILLGGMGGITGALYGLWTHVARDRDYDPQFALWYYSNPLMGLLLGGLAYILMQVGILAVSGGEPITPSPYTTWVLAFAVGFQQNLAFSLLNTILNRIIPAEEKHGVKPGETGAGAGAGGSGEAPRFPSPKK
jgi:hypothetical protein